MENILEKQVGELTLLDGFLVAGAKIGTEQILARVPYVGNGTFKSGAIKVAGALALSMASKNKYVRILSTGMLVDGMEDVVIGLQARYMGGGSASASNQQQEVGFN